MWPVGQGPALSRVRANQEAGGSEPQLPQDDGLAWQSAMPQAARVERVTSVLTAPGKRVEGRAETRGAFPFVQKVAVWQPTHSAARRGRQPSRVSIRSTGVKSNDSAGSW